MPIGASWQASPACRDAGEGDSAVFPGRQPSASRSPTRRWHFPTFFQQQQPKHVDDTACWPPPARSTLLGSSTGSISGGQGTSYISNNNLHNSSRTNDFGIWFSAQNDLVLAQALLRQHKMKHQKKGEEELLSVLPVMVYMCFAWWGWRWR